MGRPIVLRDWKLYQELRQWFQIKLDSPHCCQERAEHDEIVFHFRNFVTEIHMDKFRTLHDFIELSPNDTAEYLFGLHHYPLLLDNDGDGSDDFSDRGRRKNNNHNNTSVDSVSNHNNINTTTNNNNKHFPRKIALISRFSETATPHVVALQNHGWQVRLIQKQSGIQDFCFALSARRELVGVRKSTYAQWAGLLGNSSQVRWYQVSQTLSQPQQPQKQQHTPLVLLQQQQQPGNDTSSNTSSQFVIPPPKSPPYLLKRTVFDTHPVLQGQRRYFFQETYARQEDMTTKSLRTQANELKQLEQQEKLARINNNNNTILTAKK